MLDQLATVFWGQVCSRKIPAKDNILPNISGERPQVLWSLYSFVLHPASMQYFAK
jgi:hypothetical protein